MYRNPKIPKKLFHHQGGGTVPILPGLCSVWWHGWVSNNGTLDLRKIFAELIKKLCVEELESPSSLESFVAFRLIPLDKKPGLRPIGVGEVLRRIAGKAVMMLFKNNILHAVGALQISAGQDAGVEAIHTRYAYFFWRKYRSRFTYRCRKRFQFDQSTGNAS